MLIKKIVSEDFVHYKKPSMVIAFSRCNWKCCVEAGVPTSTCQNEPIAKMPNIDVSYEEIYDLYKQNKITSAIVFAGLEPMDQQRDVINLVEYIRDSGCTDDIVIYTGYTKDEIINVVYYLERYPNIIIKYGRFVPGKCKRHDDVLGVDLASPNQYAEAI